MYTHVTIINNLLTYFHSHWTDLFVLLSAVSTYVLNFLFCFYNIYSLLYVSANFFINEAAPMFRWCEKVFQGVEGEIEEFKLDLNEIMEYMTPGETVYDNYVS